MEDPRVLVTKSRSALGRAESAFAKVQSIGKIGNERCAELTSRINNFVLSYESAREEVNAALALVTTGEKEGQHPGSSRSTSKNGSDDAAASTVREAMELEASAEEHLRAARDANADFQRQRKVVRELAADAWDQLVAIAKMVADADKLASKAEAEWQHGGDGKRGGESERKALKCAEKASRRAEKAELCAVDTEGSLCNIMAGLREGRSALHEAEGHLSSGLVKVEQARGVALGVWEMMGVPAPRLNSNNNNNNNNHSSSSSEGGHVSPHGQTAVHHSRLAVNVMRPASSSTSSSSAGLGEQKMRNFFLTHQSLSSISDGDGAGGRGGGGGKEGEELEVAGRGREDEDLEGTQDDAEEEEQGVAALAVRHSLAKSEDKLAELTKQRQALERSLNQSSSKHSSSSGSGKKEKKSGGGGGSNSSRVSSDRGSTTTSTSEWEDTSGGGSGSGLSSSSSAARQREERRQHKSASVCAMMEALAVKEGAAADKVSQLKAQQREAFLAWAERKQQRRESSCSNSSSSSSSSSSSVNRNSSSGDAARGGGGGHDARRRGRRRQGSWSVLSEEDRATLAEHYFTLAAELEDDELLPQAVECYRASLRYKWGQAEAHYNCAIVLDSLQRFQESVESSRAALELNPEWAEAHYNLGQTFDSIGDLDGAVACYKAAAHHRPGWDDALHNLAAAESERAESSNKAQQGGLGNDSIAGTPQTFVPVPMSSPHSLPHGQVSSEHLPRPTPRNQTPNKSNQMVERHLLFGAVVAGLGNSVPIEQAAPQIEGNSSKSGGLGLLASTFYDGHSDDDKDGGGGDREWDIESASSVNSDNSNSSASSGGSFWSAYSKHSSKASSLHSRPSSGASGGCRGGGSRGGSSGRRSPSMPSIEAQQQLDRRSSSSGGGSGVSGGVSGGVVRAGKGQRASGGYWPSGGSDDEEDEAQSTEDDRSGTSQSSAHSADTHHGTKSTTRGAGGGRSGREPQKYHDRIGEGDPSAVDGEVDKDGKNCALS